MIGVNFQPGADQFGQQNGNAKPTGGSGVQEAIKILSLRLPRVVGAQASVPMPLMTSQGSGGNRVDSIVNQVMSRLPMGMQPPTAGTNIHKQLGNLYGGGPSFTGDAAPQYQPSAQSPWQPPSGFSPRVVVDNPPTWGTDADVRMPGDMGMPPGAIAPAPSGDLLEQIRRIFNPPQGPSDGGYEQPLF